MVLEKSGGQTSVERHVSLAIFSDDHLYISDAVVICMGVWLTKITSQMML